MVRLYGVTHSADVDFFFCSRPISIDPAIELLDDLTKLPTGSRVGVEWFEGNCWQEIKNDLARRSFDAGLHAVPFFDGSASHYWEVLVDELHELNLQPIFLEDKATWFRYNQAVIDLAKVNQDEPVYIKGESNGGYHAILCRYNEEKRKRLLILRKIHEIERDSILLSAVASGKLDAAIVGVGHSDYWIENIDLIQRQAEIKFDQYSKQQLEGRTYPPSVFLVRDAEPDQTQIYGRESLERAIRLMECGRIVEGTPDYVGTWCDDEPSKGYFEVFVHRKSGKEISGVIEDVLGTATFKGRVNGKGIQFTKVYTEAAAEAVRGEIQYQAKKVGDEFYGIFKIPGFRGPFYLVEADKKDPVEMGVRMSELIHQ